MPTDSLILVGAGGHAKVVLDALHAADAAGPVTIMDDNKALEGQLLQDLPIQTPINWTPNAGTTFHVAIGHNETRARFHATGRSSQWTPHTVVHPDATVSAQAMIGAGTFVAARAVIAPSASVGEGVIVNHGAVVDHDCTVGDFTHIAPLAALGGGVKIGRLVLIGAGAIVLPGRTVGNNATVGAGAVVTHDVAASVTVTGIPARPLP